MTEPINSHRNSIHYGKGPFPYCIWCGEAKDPQVEDHLCVECRDEITPRESTGQEPVTSDQWRHARTALG